jgi:MFS family permease
MSGERARLAAIALGAILAPLNSTMIVIALPRLMDDFGESLTAATWLVTTYLVAMAVLQPLAGRLGDRVGRRPLVLAGFVWFGLASAGAAASGSLEVLIAFRVQQAAAAALIFPNAMALLRELGPPERLGSRLGTVSAVVPLSAAAGPPLAGVLLALFDWQALFLVNLPIVALALVLALRTIPRGVVSAPEAREPQAARAPRLLRAPGFAVATGAIALSNLALYMTLLTIPVLLARRGGWTSEEVGLVLATLSLAAFALSPYGGRLADRAGRRLPAASGLALVAVGLVVLAIAPGAIGAVALSFAMLAMGVGMGLSTPALQASAIESVAASASGAASGVAATSRYIGSITGTLLVAGPLAPAATGTDGFGLIFAVLAAAAGAGLLLALALPGRGVAAGARGAGLGQPNFG